MQGVVVGGWEYVWAAYGVTAAGLIGYAIWLVKSLKDTRND